MENLTIKNLLTNAGLKVIGFNDDFVQIYDPSCILPAFDTVLHYAWVIILVLIAIMIFGWGVLYIKNGVKLDSVFHNAKTIVLILAVLALVKPIVNFVYGDDLFAKGCDKKNISLSAVKDLLKQREQKFGDIDTYQQYEIFDVIDSGVIQEESDETDENDDI